MFKKSRFRRRRRSGRDFVLAFLLLVGVAVAAAWLETANTQSLDGTFAVIDGDSLRQDSTELRLVGIDAPELGQSCWRNGTDWACGRAARDHLKTLMRGTVRCEGHEQDRFERLLVRCMAGDMVINQAMVEAGFAVAFGQYERQERLAREAERGVWASEFERPSDWRAERMADMVETQHIKGLRDYFDGAVAWMKSALGGPTQ